MRVSVRSYAETRGDGAPTSDAEEGSGIREVCHPPVQDNTRESAEELADHIGEAGALFLAHLHKLDAHAVAGLGGANGGACAHLSGGRFEDELDEGAGRRRFVFMNEESAEAETTDAGDVVARGGAPCDDDRSRRRSAGVAALSSVNGFGHESLAFRAGTRGES